jgi:hypothetical protein
MFAVGAPITAVESRADVPRGSEGTMTLAVPISALGTYEFRYYSKKDTLKAISEPFTVTRDMRLTIPAWESSFVGEPVVIGWLGVGREGDTLTVALSGAPPTEVVTSIPTGGASSGSYAFDDLGEGRYEARLLDTEARLISTSSSFEVVPVAPAAVSADQGVAGEDIELRWVNEGHRAQWLSVTAVGSPVTASLIAGNLRGEAVGNLSVRLPPGDYVAQMLDTLLTTVGVSTELQVPVGPGPRGFSVFTLRDQYYAFQPVNFCWVSRRMPMDSYFYVVMDTATGNAPAYGSFTAGSGFSESGFVSSTAPSGQYALTIYDRWGRNVGSSPPIVVLPSPVIADQVSYNWGDPIGLSWNDLPDESGVLAMAMSDSMPWDSVASCPVVHGSASAGACTITDVPVGHYDVRFIGDHSTEVRSVLTVDVNPPSSPPNP